MVASLKAALCACREEDEISVDQSTNIIQKTSHWVNFSEEQKQMKIDYDIQVRHQSDVIEQLN